MVGGGVSGQPENPPGYATESILIIPPAILIILILAELSLPTYYFFLAQHSEPCVIVGSMIALKTLSFNLTGIFYLIFPSIHFLHRSQILLSHTIIIITIYTLDAEVKLCSIVFTAMQYKSLCLYMLVTSHEAHSIQY